MYGTLPEMTVRARDLLILGAVLAGIVVVGLLSPDVDGPRYAGIGIALAVTVLTTALDRAEL